MKWAMLFFCFSNSNTKFSLQSVEMLQWLHDRDVADRVRAMHWTGNKSSHLKEKIFSSRKEDCVCCLYCNFWWWWLLLVSLLDGYGNCLICLLISIRILLQSPNVRRSVYSIESSLIWVSINNQSPTLHFVQISGTASQSTIVIVVYPFHCFSSSSSLLEWSN